MTEIVKKEKKIRVKKEKLPTVEFMPDLKKRLEEKGLSETSIKLYFNNLRKLNDDKTSEIKSFNFLENPEDIQQKIAKLKPNTQKGYLTCIVSILNCYKDNKKLTKLCEKYYTIMKTHVDKLKETPPDELTATQHHNWLTWDEVKTVYDDLYKKVAEFSGVGTPHRAPSASGIAKKSLTPHQFNMLEDLVILAVFVLIPPRRNMDYTDMLIVGEEPSAEDKEHNYLVWGDNTPQTPDRKRNCGDSPYFLFNKFKTSKDKAFAGYKEEIPADLKSILKTFIKFHPLMEKGKVNKETRVAFLATADGKAITAQNFITRVLNRLFGKAVGCSMLRHIYLTHKYGKETAEREADAVAMAHSTSTQQDYIKNPTKLPTKMKE